MRTKQEILKAYLDEGLGCKSDAHLSMLTVTSILEILIDIRDTLAADVTGRIAVLQDMVRHKGGD